MLALSQALLTFC